MSHFAIPGDENLPTEDDVALGLDGGGMMFALGIEPLGLSLIPKDLTFTIVLFAFSAGIDAAGWWSR
ncbi:hypothetical protein ABIA35_009827 [Catenulispora sp. MAP12-49]|uniref:hypothetical protein n=1 Tax=unclassified Catenulispora TaxID=414885 RepID=UPI003513FDF4